MTSAELRLHLSELAHSLATRHSEASYFRPQYYAALCEALDEHQHLELKGLVMGELIAAVQSQSGCVVGEVHRELLWASFGAERLDPRADLSTRSSAFKAFERRAGAAGLPERVVEKAWLLYDSPSSFAPRILPLPFLRVDTALRKNPLSALESLLALAEWKLGNPGSSVARWQAWLTNMVSWQVRWRFTLGVPASIEIDDISQEALVGVLQRLAVYQPGPRVSLERWVFGITNQVAGMAIRKLRRTADKVVACEAVESWLAPDNSAEESARIASAELVEHAMARMRAAGAKPDIGYRVEVLVDSLGVLLGAGAPRDADELAEQLRSYFPQIREDQIARIVAHSGMRQTSRESC